MSSRHESAVDRGEGGPRGLLWTVSLRDLVRYAPAVNGSAMAPSPAAASALSRHGIDRRGRTGANYRWKVTDITASQPL